MFTLNFHEFLHTVYEYVLNSVIKISVMFARYFEYYTSILRGGGRFFVDTLVLYGQDNSGMTACRLNSASKAFGGRASMYLAYLLSGRDYGECRLPQC